MQRVLSLYDYSGIMVQPWEQAGFCCFIVDIEHPKGTSKIRENLYSIGCDLKKGYSLSDEFKSELAFVSAFPPCDHLAISGTRWFKGKGLRALSEAIELFATAAEVCEDSNAPYLIENPVSTISTYWRKPDYTFHPYEYTGYNIEDNYTKKTCLWTGNGFVMPEKKIIRNLGNPDSRIFNHCDSKARKKNRSLTPLGFAKAVFEANKPGNTVKCDYRSGKFF